MKHRKISNIFLLLSIIGIVILIYSHFIRNELAFLLATLLTISPGIVGFFEHLKALEEEKD